MVQKKYFWFTISALLIFMTASVFPVSQTITGTIPVTEDSSTTGQNELVANILPITEFSSSIQDGEDVLRGVYVNQLMALRVVQQPSGKDGFVSSIEGVATQFRLADKYGTVGLLAHNFAAGSYFTDIQAGDVINAIYGNGEINRYKVTKIVKFQALSPNSATSNFIDLSSGDKLSAGKLFQQIYNGESDLVMQTCIAKDGEPSWGRVFILAKLLSDEKE